MPCSPVICSSLAGDDGAGCRRVRSGNHTFRPSFPASRCVREGAGCEGSTRTWGALPALAPLGSEPLEGHLRVLTRSPTDPRAAVCAAPAGLFGLWGKVVIAEGAVCGCLRPRQL